MRFVAILAACLALCAGRAAAATPAGTVISNTASATYQSSDGKTYATRSNTQSVMVAAVGAILVTPKQTAVNPATDGYLLGTSFTRTFTITNTSNITDAYKVTALSTQAGKITSAVFNLPGGGTLPIVVGQTVSPSIAPAGTITVTVAIDGSGVASGTAFSIALTASTTVSGTANGIATDSGEVWAIPIASGQFVNPGNASLPIAKLVNGQPSYGAQPGEVVTFSLPVKNAGGYAATSTVVEDVLPAGLTADPATATVNGTAVPATLNGQDLKIQAGTIAAGATVTIAFNATVASSAKLGTVFTNVATIVAANIPIKTSDPATVLVGSYNIVYDGARGAAAPIGGAIVSLLDPKTSQPVPLTGEAIAPNSQNANPYTTGATGAYSYGFFVSTAASASVRSARPSAAASVRYIIAISAPGYLNRRIQLDAVPNASGNLFHATLTSLDGQPLASPGGFTLVTSGDVSFGDLYGFFGNLPMFRPGAITVTKTGDRQTVQAGDRIIYTVTFTNNAQVDLAVAKVVDTLPPSIAYAPGSGRVDGADQEPTVSGRALTWTVPSLAAGVTHTITYAAVIVPPVQDQTTLTNLVTVSSSGQSGTASYAVQVVGGLFSYRIDILGRVFADVKGTHHMTDGDFGVPGVRVYLEDGTSVVTDANGRFTFPSIRPGEHVLRLDETTVPPGLRVYAGTFPYDDQRAKTRLVHGLFDASLPEDINFALEPIR
jgi:fimbrial isopeptide formation D2 family protein/uncharacterized repeat protein (TIGR01451 family)